MRGVFFNDWLMTPHSLALISANAGAKVRTTGSFLPQYSNFFEYVLNDGKRKTMHKTKGSGIQNVAIVLDNFAWYKYNFTKMFNDDSGKEDNHSLNLFYVACSRAIENLIIMKFVESEVEIKMLKDKFENKEANINFKEIKLSEIYKVPVMN